jgi:hypothetical protein
MTPDLPSRPELRTTTFEVLAEHEVRRWVWEPDDQRWTDRGTFDPADAPPIERRPLTEAEQRHAEELARTLGPDQ